MIAGQADVRRCPWLSITSGLARPGGHDNQPDHEFIRRFLMHTLPDGFHRIRHYGLLANGHRADKIELCRKLLAAPSPRSNHDNDNSNEVAPANDPPPCPCCGGRMKIIETFERTYGSRAESHGARRFGSS
jgi:Putative transposase